MNRAYGTTYYWATYALPRVKRHHVHALYGFCRFADEIVDDPGFGTVAQREAALGDFSRRFFADLDAGRSDDLVLKAVIHTIRAFDLDIDLFERFLRSMTMDLTVETYETWADLELYVDGSAAVIGEMMMPILEPVDAERARAGARALGIAFQLTNFLRDVGEDLDRGRVYIPQEDLRRFGADPHRRTVDAAWIHLMHFEIERCHQLYAEADRGIRDLPASSARGIWAARRLYAGILDEIAGNAYDVFTQRARVPAWEKARVVALSALGRPPS
nr:phytoene/squalene synthase family protein [Rhabdothermincola salaria]